ncbi:phosphotransferase [Streptomyces sp. MP131-18]|uniref:phosphotransferase n=1 Tax=Streptomyces sp. MP131-18 TaxID=1857892 RepID=UPI00097BBAE3|nr:phosphotransferase [Streptomyces sp. MP131-18]ONK12690.1 serine/threonine protein kinase [Streptomyces sp. MP131-18]
MQTGERIGSGRSADVYALVGDPGRVLRRYRDGTDATGEAALMARLAALGYPVPAVHPEDAPGPTDLVMERLTGPTMLQTLLTETAAADVGARAGATLAGLLHRLHALPGRIVHLDLHPDNVILGPRGPVVIDWCNADTGPPGLDCAMSALILAQAAVGAFPQARPVLATLLPRLDGTLETHLPAATARRAADRGAAQEAALLDEAVALIHALRGAQPQISL